MVDDALSRKSHGMLTSVASEEWQMLKTVEQFRLHYKGQAQGTLDSLVATPSFLTRVIKSQGQDTEILSINYRVRIGDEGWVIHTDGSFQYRGRVVVPQSVDLGEEILREFYCSHFVVHPGGTKMYHDLRL